MLDNIPFPMIVLAGGVLLAVSFFGMMWLRSRVRNRKPAEKASTPVVPLAGQSISERAVYAKRNSEIEAERLLEKQEAELAIAKRKAVVDDVLAASAGAIVKNG